MRAIEFVPIQALARSACTSRVPPIRHNSLWLGPAGWDTYSVWPPPGALDLQAYLRVRKTVAEISVGHEHNAERQALVRQQNQINTNKQ